MDGLRYKIRYREDVGVVWKDPHRAESANTRPAVMEEVVVGVLEASHRTLIVKMAQGRRKRACLRVLVRNRAYVPVL